MCKVLSLLEEFNWSEYKDWLGNMCFGPDKYNYELLLTTLMDIPFRWSIDLDKNRAVDGKNLRIQFADIYGMYLDDEDLEVPASVLEVLAALALRIETDIMAEPDEYYAAKWFNRFMENLNLDMFMDSHFDGVYIRTKVDQWMDRKYTRRGTFGLFPIMGNYGDQRTIEIWRQMNTWLHENYPLT